MELSSTPMLWLQLAIAAAVILGIAAQLTKSADIIAFKTGLGRSFIGVVLLATATSLPELGTGISSVTLIGGAAGANLAAGDAFGSNIFNLMIIGILDLLWRKGSIFQGLSSSPAIVGLLGILVIGCAAVSIMVHNQADFMTSFSVSPMSIGLLLVFIVALFAVFREGKENDQADDNPDYSEKSLGIAFTIYGISAAIIVVTAIWLAQTGESLAEAMHWDRSFVGTQFLALSTSLPELAASIAALRIMAPELAITNVLGSNLFNMGFVLFMDDVTYVDGAIWAILSPVHIVTASMAILMTVVVLVPIMGKSRLSFGRAVSMEAILLIGLYLVTSFLIFYLGDPH